MLGVGRLVGVVEGEVGLLHALLEVAGLAGHARDEVLLRLVRDGDGHVRILLVVDDGRAGGHGLVDGEHGLEHLVLHLDLLDGGERLLLGLGGDGGHAVAHEPHLRVEHERVVRRRLREPLPRRAVRDARNVAVPQHAAHAGHLLRLADVDGLDARVRVRTPEHLYDERIRRHEIADVRIAAERELFGIEFGDRVVGLLEVFGLGGGGTRFEGVLFHAALFTRSRGKKQTLARALRPRGIFQ